uniref:Uncharacterized protein n=1 Tax=Poecilia reticulata TaxID=8081 RepID=A0A3P9QB94_POERE
WDKQRHRKGDAAAPSSSYLSTHLCKRQQCTIERRGFRQELDSWRHKLIHCVGFESILEGLFGPGLVKDVTFFQGKHALSTNGQKHNMLLQILTSISRT